jgi:hypothetical protein
VVTEKEEGCIRHVEHLDHLLGKVNERLGLEASLITEQQSKVATDLRNLDEAEGKQKL